MPENLSRRKHLARLFYQLLLRKVCVIKQKIFSKMTYNSVKLLTIFLLAASFAAFFLPKAKAEQVTCPPREILIESLKHAGMLPVWRGWSDKGHITEIFINMDDESNNWVAVVHLPSNNSCVVDGGIRGKFLLQGKVAT